MTEAQRSYIHRETAIGVAINAALSALFAFVVFGGRALVPVDEIVLDALPQSFMIALMATLVPTAITRRRLRAGSIAPLPALTSRLPGHLLLRGLLVAVVAALVGGALHWLLLPRLAPGAWPFLPLLAYKIVYGGALALLVGPIVLRRALADVPPAAQGAS
jgi:hypothetical protein